MSINITLPSIYTTSPATVTVTNNSGNVVSVSPWTQSLHVLGDASFEGDIKIKEKSLSDFMEKVEERLNILSLNKKLEAEWEELKTIGDKYRALEKELIEKNEMWNILKR